MRWRSWRDSSGMARSLPMVLSSTWPGVACSPWQPIRRFGVLFKEGGNGGLTGDDGNARDYSVEKPTWGRLDVRALSVKGGWLAEDRSWEADFPFLIPEASRTPELRFGSCPSRQQFARESVGNMLALRSS